MNTTTSEAYVKVEISALGIGEITFFHPAHNAMPSHLLAELVIAIESAGEDEAVKVIVLKSGGNRTFCAGASFKELIAIDDLETGKRFFLGFANVINACRKCPKLIVGRVQGKAVGGGVGIAAAMDYCIATKHAAIKLSELSVGIGPFVISPAVERKIGLAAYTQLSINATEFQSANWAQAKGLYAQVHDTLEQADEAVQQLAQQLAKTNPYAQQMLKQTAWANCQHWDTLLEERAAISGQLVLSDYTKAALARFE
ncbi:MAG: enoyl-CoA hydratase/isomerase family protein [Bacteroidota bacterium]